MTPTEVSLASPRPPPKPIGFIGPELPFCTLHIEMRDLAHMEDKKIARAGALKDEAAIGQTIAPADPIPSPTDNDAAPTPTPITGHLSGYCMGIDALVEKVGKEGVPLFEAAAALKTSARASFAA